MLLTMGDKNEKRHGCVASAANPFNNRAKRPGHPSKPAMVCMQAPLRRWELLHMSTLTSLHTLAQLHWSMWIHKSMALHMPSLGLSRILGPLHRLALLHK